MNIVMIDSAQLVGDVDFPDVNLIKYGWLQYLGLGADELEERCWRADIIISVNTPVPREVMEKCFKLQLLIAAGDKYDHFDQAACAERGIQISHVPGITGDNAGNSQAIADQVVANINAWLEKKPLNIVT